MKSKIFLLDKKIGKMTKKLTEKQKSWYPEVVTKMTSSWHYKCLEITSIALDPSKWNPTLLLNMWNCSIYSIFLRLKNWKTVFWVWWCYSDITACCSGLGSRYFMIFREHPLRNNNQQSNIPLKKKPKDFE